MYLFDYICQLFHQLPSCCNINNINHILILIPLDLLALLAFNISNCWLLPSFACVSLPRHWWAYGSFFWPVLKHTIALCVLDAASGFFHPQFAIIIIIGMSLWISGMSFAWCNMCSSSEGMNNHEYVVFLYCDDIFASWTILLYLYLLGQ